MQSKMEKDYEKRLFPKCMHEGNTLSVLSYMSYMLSLNLKGFSKAYVDHNAILHSVTGPKQKG